MSSSVLLIFGALFFAGPTVFAPFAALILFALGVDFAIDLDEEAAALWDDEAIAFEEDAFAVRDEEAAEFDACAAFDADAAFDGTILADGVGADEIWAAEGDDFFCLLIFFFLFDKKQVDYVN